MYKNDQVDDILAEIKRKKAQRSGPAEAEPIRQRVAEPQPARPVQPQQPAGWGDMAGSPFEQPKAPPVQEQPRFSLDAQERTTGSRWESFEPTRGSVEANEPPLRTYAPPAEPVRFSLDADEPTPRGYSSPPVERYAPPAEPVRFSLDADEPTLRGYSAPPVERYASPAPQEPVQPIHREAPMEEPPRRLSGMAQKWKMAMDDDFAAPGESPNANHYGSSLPQAAPLQDLSATRLNLPRYEEVEGMGLSSRSIENQYSAQAPNYSTEEEPYELLNTDLSEYSRPADAADIVGELAGTSKWLLTRTVVSFVSLVVLAYLSFSYYNPLPLPPFMFPEDHPGAFFGVSLGVMILCGLFSANTLGGGLISLFTLKGDNDALAALGVLGCVVQGAAMIVAPDQYRTPGVQLYLPVGALILLMNNLGKMGVLSRVGRNFNFVMRAPNQTAVLSMGSRELAHELTRSIGADQPKVTYSAKTNFLANFLQLSYSEDYSQQVCRVLAPMCLGASVITAVISYFFNSDLFVALTVFTASLCITSPLSAMFAASRPMLRATTALAKHKCMVSGYAAVDRLSETDAVVLTASQLFPQGSITLSGIKVFEQNRIDEAILDAASVVCSCESTLSGIFHEMIEGKVSLLKEIDSLVYEDGLGISAWVQGKRVLIGNRELMMGHGIDIPSKDFENRYVQSGLGIIYLANSGVLTAMYVVAYNVSDEVARMLDALEDKNISVILRTTDPNLTPQKIEEIFRYPAGMVSVVPAKLHAQLDKMTLPRPQTKAFAAFVDSPYGLARCVVTAKNCRASIYTAVILQLVGIIVGFGLVCFLSFMQSTSTLSWMVLAGYQLLWAAAVIIIPNLRRL